MTQSPNTIDIDALTDADYDRMIARLDVVFFSTEGTPEHDEMLQLADLIEAYEAKHYAI